MGRGGGKAPLPPPPWIRAWVLRYSWTFTSTPPPLDIVINLAPTVAERWNKIAKGWNKMDINLVHLDADPRLTIWGSNFLWGGGGGPPCPPPGSAPGFCVLFPCGVDGHKPLDAGANPASSISMRPTLLPLSLVHFAEAQ